MPQFHRNWGTAKFQSVLPALATMDAWGQLFTPLPKSKMKCQCHVVVVKLLDVSVLRPYIYLLPFHTSKYSQSTIQCIHCMVSEGLILQIMVCRNKVNPAWFQGEQTKYILVYTSMYSFHACIYMHIMEHYHCTPHWTSGTSIFASHSAP